MAFDKCIVETHQVAYQRAGQGETVLLVHGITTFSFIWQEVFSALIQNYDVIAVDLLGCGASDMPLDVPYSIPQHTEILHQVVTQLGVKQFHYVGHDVGGGIGQLFAVRYGDMLFDLALLNTVAYDFWPVQPIIAMRTPIIRQMAMATLDLGSLELIIRRGMFHKDKLTPELMAQFEQPMKSKLGRKAFLHFARSLDNQHLLEITDQLKKLQLPVLIMRGDGDIYLSASIAERLHRDIPGSRLVHISQGGHFSQIDEPEQVTCTLKTFWTERHS